MSQQINPKKSAKKQKEERINSSEYIQKLAQPKKISSMSDYEEDPSVWKIKKSSLKYKATKRIQLLSRPKYVTKKKIDRDEENEILSIPSVTPSALHYKATRRILELAMPK